MGSIDLTFVLRVATVSECERNLHNVRENSVRYLNNIFAGLMHLLREILSMGNVEHKK